MVAFSQLSFMDFFLDLFLNSGLPLTLIFFFFFTSCAVLGYTLLSLTSLLSVYNVEISMFYWDLPCGLEYLTINGLL